MTKEERAEINKQNASHSTGPKTEEGKAKSAQNATTHGLSSSIPPLQNPRFQQILANFIHEHKPQTPPKMSSSSNSPTRPSRSNKSLN